MTEELFLFNDTETTGFPKKSGGVIQPGQARVCQIALLLTDGTGRSLCEFSSLIKPEGWEVSEGAAAVHGFSTAQCDLYGLSQNGVMQLYRSLASMAGVIVAHNSDFDKQMMGIEEAYYNSGRPPEKHMTVKNEWFCTMKPNTHVTGGKWPKLNEALKHFTGRDLGDFAHDAMYDVKACRDIFFAMRQKKAA